MSVSAMSVAVKIFLIEQLTIPRRLRLFVRHLQETVRHDDKLSLFINDFRLLAPRGLRYTFKTSREGAYGRYFFFFFLETKYLKNNNNIVGTQS